jgi:hypothetical protein
MVGSLCFLSFKRFFLRHAFGFRLDSRRYLLSGGPLGSEEILQDSAALRFPDTGSNQAGVV